MTKAKTAKSAADAKKTASKPAKAAKDETKKAGAAKKTAEKAKPVKAEKATKAVKPAAKPAKEEEKPAKATKPVKTAPKTKTAPKAAAPVIEEKNIAAPAASAPAFSNAGLGIKPSGKKPALSVAPGFMTLGRAAQQKPSDTPRPSERRLSKKEQGDIKTFLLEKRERLLSAMRRELAVQKERAASKAADDVDKATDAYDEDLSFEIASANDQELQDIQVALEKIEKGTYGECEICGCGISPSRLKILPSATTCVACRGQEELSRRRDDGQQIFNMLEDGEAEGEVL